MPVTNQTNYIPPAPVGPSGDVPVTGGSGGEKGKVVQSDSSSISTEQINMQAFSASAPHLKKGEGKGDKFSYPTTVQTALVIQATSGGASATTSINSNDGVVTVKLEKQNSLLIGADYLAILGQMILEYIKAMKDMRSAYNIQGIAERLEQITTRIQTMATIKERGDKQAEQLYAQGWNDIFVGIANLGATLITLGASTLWTKYKLNEADKANRASGGPGGTQGPGLTDDQKTKLSSEYQNTFSTTFSQFGTAITKFVESRDKFIQADYSGILAGIDAIKQFLDDIAASAKASKDQADNAASQVNVDEMIRSAQRAAEPMFKIFQG